MINNWVTLDLYKYDSERYNDVRFSESTRMTYNIQLPEDYFWLLSMCLQKLGISFRESESGRYKILSKVWFVALVITYCCLEPIEVYMHFDDQDKLTNILSFLVTDVLSMLQIMSFYRA